MKHAIVTGGASGIGAAIVARLVRDGATVTVFDLAPSTDNHPVVACDISSEADVRDAVAADLAEYGSIDALINCAGVVEKSEAVKTALDSWNRVLAVNLTGAFLVSREVGRSMAARGSGSIVTIASVDGHTPDAGEISYSTSKAGVLGMTRALALELGPYGVRVNSVSPGLVITPMTLKNSAADPRARRVLEGNFKRIPLRRGVKPEEVAATCAFLASAESSGITGQDIAVDGGMLADGYLVNSLRDAVDLGHGDG